MSLLSKITAKPWEHAGEMDGVHGEYIVTRPAGQIGLWLFLAVVTSFFMLFIVSYYTRSQFPDWEILAEPGILWVNTGMLVLASISLQLASHAARRDKLARMRYFLIGGALLTMAFVVGQWMAWEQLASEGYYAQENPATAFFYLLTGLHALHLLGGLWFMVLLGFRLKRADQQEKARQSVALCATYWHYLLLVWLVLFTLLLRT
jgi:cytochrome c oxidase subunit 3